VLSADPVLIDTCTLINLLASGEPELLVSGLSSICMVCEAVSRESLFLRAEQENAPPERITLDPLFASGILHPCQAQSPEEETLYVSLAAELDDGEALSLAISSVRGYGLATDDRKARRLANEIGSVRLFSTAEILHSIAPLDSTRIREIIRRIESRARYMPHRGTPLSDWWNAHRS
jgi:predicted nucleic acid-binding protein